MREVRSSGNLRHNKRSSSPCSCNLNGDSPRSENQRETS
nr:MAG TPA: hypothetical protein [Caudoviricetes sp.]